MESLDEVMYQKWDEIGTERGENIRNQILGYQSETIGLIPEDMTSLFTALDRAAECDTHELSQGPQD